MAHGYTGAVMPRLATNSVAVGSLSSDKRSHVSGFLDYKTVEVGISANTREKYGTILSLFSSFLGKKEPSRATEREVRNYISACFDRELEPSSIANSISCLREFFKYLLKAGVIRQNPMTRIESPKQWKRIPRAISETEVMALLNAAQPRHRQELPAYNVALQLAVALRDLSIVEVLYSSAMRASELISARLSDLRLEERTLTVSGKGSKMRLVPLGRPAVAALHHYLNVRPLLERTPSPFLFIGRRGRKLTRQRLWQILNALAKRAGVMYVSPHVLRHSAATHMLDHRADLRTIQTILGHEYIGSTERYLKVAQERLREVLQRCHPLSNPKRQQMALFPPPSLVPGAIICSQCVAPALEGSTFCALHLKLNRERSKRSWRKAHPKRQKAERERKKAGSVHPSRKRKAA
jgi:integrase/recombinase XerD